ncbi:MAG TPA: DUF2071 domain-containing protein [Egibacteraceae bacterium]|nr:DUF2071 domain-containing protein [Actinomycetota bacterium]HWB71519.1 DUF2071 domain-containing protein [Egibacteraceae bacterium]
MAGAEPEEQIRLPMFYQSWRDVTFLHWRYEPSAVHGLLPSGLEPDVRDGAAWVGLTPLRVERFRLPLLPPAPGVSSFPETNLRTYVLGPDGSDGLWFFTLEVDSIPTTVAARLGFRVPYRWAEMQVERNGPRIGYRSRRRGRPAVGHRIVVEPSAPLQAQELDEFDHWLTGRWRAWTRIAGRWADLRVHHPPWPLWRAELATLEQTLLTSVGLPPPDHPPLVHFSPGVDVRFGPPRFSR